MKIAGSSPKWVENTVGKGTSNFSFSHIVFKRPALQKSRNQGLFGKGLNQKALLTKPHLFKMKKRGNQAIWLNISSFSAIESVEYHSM